MVVVKCTVSKRETEREAMYLVFEHNIHFLCLYSQFQVVNSVKIVIIFSHLHQSRNGPESSTGSAMLNYFLFFAHAISLSTYP